MTKFGIGQIGNDTPKYAKYAFRVYFFTSKAFIGWAAATDIFSEQFTHNITLFITLLADPILFGLSKMFGPTPEESETQNQENAETNK